MRTSYLLRAAVSGCLCALVNLPVPALPEVVTLAPIRDASLMEIAPDRNNGGDGWILSGTTQNGTQNRALLQWDLSEIPVGSMIVSAELSLEVTRVPGCGIANSAFGLYRMLVPWGEGDKIALDNQGGQGAPATDGDSTWKESFFGAQSWAAPGGLPGVDFVSTSSSSEYVYDTGRSPYFFRSTPEFVDDVQTWVNDPVSNFGWILISDDEATPFTARRFGSHEDPNASPYLTIEYVPVPEPGPVVLGGMGLVVLGVVLCRRRRGPGGRATALL